MRSKRFIRMTGLTLGPAVLLMGCDPQPSLDRFSAPTSSGAEAIVNSGARPQPDANGIIRYPTYQVAVAEPGDTVASMAGRLGLEPATLARFNGLSADADLRAGEVVVLPEGVEPTIAGPDIETSVIQPPPGSVDITAIAGSAIDASAERTPAAASVQEGPAPIRHRVAQGETAFTISRLYNVSVKSLAEWNGLGPDLEVRTGQVLLVPVPDSTLAPTAAATTATAVAAPGAGSQTPTPPSSTQPLPKPEEAAAPIEEPSDPVSGSATEASDTAALLLPVQGNIIKAFRKGTNDGIDIEAPAGAPVAAADSGTVAAITRDVNNIPILVLRHDDGLLTVYDGIDDISVKKGDSVRRGQQIAKVRAGNPSFLHFETRQGFDSVDPMEFLN